MLYPDRRGSTFNFDYYLERHIAWARKLVPDEGTEIRKGISNPQKHGQKRMSDVSNFTNIQPMLQIDELVRISK